MAATTFTVEGYAPFPFDMLRYDVCWPQTQEDTHKMERMTRRDGQRIKFQVTLGTNGHPPTEDRWKSFGWTVIQRSRGRREFGAR
jgi:hypothetical protein